MMLYIIISAATNDCLVYKLSENSEKCNFPRGQHDLLTLVLSEPKDFQFTIMKKTEKSYKSSHLTSMTFHMRA